MQRGESDRQGADLGESYCHAVRLNFILVKVTLALIRLRNGDVRVSRPDER